MIKAHWMLQGGRTEEEWNNLPFPTIKLLTAEYFAEEQRQMDIFEMAIRKAFSKKQSNNNGGV